jgi:outer membrane biosynthesis protein TonB
MAEQSFPILCQLKTCGKPLYGPVKYCPYCGFMNPVVEEVSEKVETGQVAEESAVTPTNTEKTSQEQPSISEPEIEKKSAKKPEQVAQPGDKTPDKKSEENKVPQEEKAPEKKEEAPKTEKKPHIAVPPQPEPKPDPKPGNLKWAVIAVVLALAVAGYFFVHKNGKGPADTSVSPQSPEATTSTNGPRDSARILAQDALRKGTDLSVTISKIPKLEKVLEAARNLGEISPRYQDQITSAESTVKAATDDRDKSLLAYIGKVTELGRYTPGDVSYAMGVVKKEDRSPREKIVVELLDANVKSERDSGSDPKKVLRDFTGRFMDFVE